MRCQQAEAAAEMAAAALLGEIYGCCFVSLHQSSTYTKTQARSDSFIGRTLRGVGGRGTGRGLNDGKEVYCHTPPRPYPDRRGGACLKANAVLPAIWRDFSIAPKLKTSQSFILVGQELLCSSPNLRLSEHQPYQELAGIECWGVLPKVARKSYPEFDINYFPSRALMKEPGPKLLVTTLGRGLLSALEYL